MTHIDCEHGTFNVTKGYGCGACLTAEITRLKASLKEANEARDNLRRIVDEYEAREEARDD